MQLIPRTHPNSFQHLWDDPAIEERIATGIETHRKGDAVVRVCNPDGTPCPGVKVTARQQDASFHFGSNIFKLDGYETAEANRRYEEAFCGLFNAATVPFYWKKLEPEPGQLRFAADSAPIPRRPPPDRVVDFCQKHGLRMHGHTLIWSYLRWSIPDWLPRDPAEIDRLLEKRIREIADRYGSIIKRWDVVNEATANYPDDQVHPMPEEYERKAFEWAAKYFPEDVRLDINEVTHYWYPHKQQYVDLIQRLRDQGARIGGVGLQFHLFTDEELDRLTKGEDFTPRQMLETLDAYETFDLPVHISEITLTAPDNSPEGLEAQADVARKLYRLWFSHPSVEGITWWNLPDGGAAPGEDTVFSGLLFDDLTPKPSYHALKDLIQKEWRTEMTGVTDETGCFRFRGFHGNYQIQAEGNELTCLRIEPGASTPSEVATTLN